MLTPMARILVRSHRSERRPSGTPTAAYKSTNAVFSQPSALSLRPHSLRIGSVTAARIWRSKKFIMLMPNRTHSTYVDLLRFAITLVSPSLKTRLSLLKESGHAFHEIFGVKTRVLIDRFEIERRGEVRILPVIQTFLYLSQGYRCGDRKSRGHRVDRRVEFFVGNDSIHQTQGQRFCCSD